MGFSADEVIGQSIRSFMTPESVAYSRAVSWPTLLEKGEMLDAEFRLVTKSGAVLDVLAADSGEGDWPFRPMVITDSGDRDRGGGVHFWQLCCGLKGAAGQGRTRWSVDCPGSPWEGPVRGAERPL